MYIGKSSPCYIVKKSYECISCAPVSSVAQKSLSWQHATFMMTHQMETFSALLAICAGNSPVPVNSTHKGQWRGALVFSWICTRIDGWVNNGEAGDLRRHRAHYDVNILTCSDKGLGPNGRQAITWRNDDPVHWRIYASLGIIVLKLWWK